MAKRIQIRLKENTGDKNRIIPKHILLESKNSNPREATGQQNFTKERIKTF